MSPLPSSDSDAHAAGSIPLVPHSIPYRPDIDGLRAIAVVAVVLFHAPLLCPGGYVGVDVFFVLSGYLITSLILRDIRNDRFSLADFWERRVRRIFPALGLMVAVTLIVGGLLMLPLDYEQLGKSAIAQAMLVANFFFWRDDSAHGGYFGPSSEVRPLLHTWSLAVEEQFYMLFPLLLVGLFRMKRFHQPRNLSRFLCLGTLIGLAVAVIGLKFSPGATFYLLPTRAWELMGGAWLAALPAETAPRRRLVREGASWLGLAAILLPCWLYSKNTPFPGLAALPPCVGALLVIWSNSRPTDHDPGLTWAGRILALRPVVFIGWISYSLYLWHWPVLVFGKYWWLHPTSPWYFRVGLLAVAGILAVLSWRFVETPFRLKKIAGSRKAIMGLAGASTAVFMVISAGLILTKGFPARLPADVARNAAAIEDGFKPEDYDLGSEDIRNNRLIHFGTSSPEVSPSILLWGDSHAQHAIAAFDAFGKELGIAGVAASRGAKPPVVDAVFHTGFEADPEFGDAVIDYIKRTHISHVVMAARWCWYEGLDPQLLVKSLTGTIETLRSQGCTVWVLLDVPDVDTDAPKMLIRSAIFHYDDVSWYRTVTDHQRLNSVMYQLARDNRMATFLDPSLAVMDVKSGLYRPTIDGVSLYFDKNHLTRSASRKIFIPLLREKMADQLVPQDPSGTSGGSTKPAHATKVAPDQ